MRVQPVTHELVIAAVIFRRRFHLSQWDATILAAAAELGCKTLYSEDMSHGQDYGGVRGINPFLTGRYPQSESSALQINPRSRHIFIRPTADLKLLVE